MSVLVVFTSNPKEAIVQNGGTGHWVASERSLRNVTHVIMCHNAYDPHRPGNPTDHGKAFLIGTYAGYTGDERKFIKLGSVADLDLPDFWASDRNPVRYYKESEMDEMLAARNVSLSDLTWHDMEDLQVESPLDETEGASAGRFIQHALQYARSDIANALGLPIEQVHLDLRIASAS